METKLLNLMLYRQTLLVRHLSRSVREISMQLEIQKSFLAELKDTTNYFKSEFGKNELAVFPVELEKEYDQGKSCPIPDEFAGRHPLECQE